jgi:hypothetical protein
LEPYFDLHNHVKRNVLQALIEQCKISYADSTDEFITFTLDDLSVQQLKIDGQLLDDSTLGIFVTNSSNAHESVELVKQLAHAAQQNNAIKMSSVIKVVRSQGIQEAEELLEQGENEMDAQVQRNQLQAIEAQGKNEEKARAWEKEKMDIENKHKLEQIKAKGDIDLQRQAMLSLGFNEDLDEKKFEEDKKQNKEKNALEKKKIEQSNKKN